MRYFLIIICVIASCFFIACSGTISYPDWYLKSQSDSRYLYGVGEADSLQDAKLAALNDLASKISLNIESNINIQKEQIDSKVTSKINNNVGINVSDIELDSVEHPIIEEIDGLFFVQARVEKVKIINKLNSDIDSSAIKINSILSDIKNSKCSTMSPKHREKLLELLALSDYKSQQISSLNGVVRQKQLLDNVANMLLHPPRAYYISFAKGGNSNDYKLVDNALMNEYNKFFSISSKDSDIYYIENRYDIHKTNTQVTIALDSSIKDCNDNVVFNTTLEVVQDVKDKSIAIAINRLKAQLYKKIYSWIE
ncbi:hypothetical protein CCY99_05380 [Helicobacter sp. 16-1353]|uniref:LPP20 family lipoprotein n=1 Tax=Helicobacter sp. 16-1353 TaxID=2004996 RepID=UPI000DCB77E2|nr:LPP20 family lipoprotein [Helicobacter sp. 16-1353]RAX53815.1 hypothetical protein CCY99_05380 [Helicobacter sp. 16-1353]